jgi:hypothetical protein
MAFIVPFIPAIIAAAGAAVGAVGAISSAQAQSASYKSAKSAAEYNAQANRDNAIAAERAGSANELATRRTNAQRMGAMNAEVAAQGGGYSGTNVLALNQAGTNMEFDALNERYKGIMQGRGLLNEATLDDFQGKVAGMNAGAATRAGYFGAASSVLSSASNYYTMRNLNVGG